jgi:hypothetical protein
MGFFRDIISIVVANAPIERLFDRDRSIEHLRELREKLPSAAEQEVTPAPMGPSVGESSEAEETSTGVSDAQTLAYQLDRLIDDALHLETEHLPNQGRIEGLACDCIAKAARDLRRHAKETIPIAARQGHDPVVYSEAAAWAEYMIAIGSLEAVESGKHDQEYLVEAGRASNFRKEFERLHSELKGQKGQKSQIKGQKTEEPCPTCAGVQSLGSWMAERELKGEGVPPVE